MVKHMKMFTWIESRMSEWAFAETVTKPLDAYAWPGGYPIYYTDGRNDTICAECANKLRQDYIDGIWTMLLEWAECGDVDSWVDPKEGYWLRGDANYEDDHMYCDQCSKQIESAYGEKE